MMRMNTITNGLCLALLLLGGVVLAAPPDKHTDDKQSSMKNKEAEIVSRPAAKAKITPRHEGLEQARTIPAAHLVQNALYTLTGDKRGIVTLSRTATGKVVRTFRMDAGVQVREVFLLDNGAIVGASQKDHTVFWNVATGKQVGRNAGRVYGFNHAQTECFTQNAAVGTITLIAYPKLNKIGQIATDRRDSGTDAFLFSPDDRYLAVHLTTHRPEVDEDYPKGMRYAIHSSMSTHMIDLHTFKENAAFTREGIIGMGTFSADSKFYDLTGISILTLFLTDPAAFDHDPPATFQFDLTTGKLSKLP